MDEINKKNKNRIRIKVDASKHDESDALLDTLIWLTDEQVSAAWKGLAISSILKSIEQWEIQHDEWKKLDFDWAKTLIENGHLPTLMKNIKAFKWKDHKKIILEVIEHLEPDKNNNYSQYNLSNFEWLDEEVAMRLIDKWLADLLNNNIHHFNSLGKEVFFKLIDKWREDILDDNMFNFKWFDKEDAIKVIDMGKEDFLSKKIEWFKWLDGDVALKLIDKWREDILDSSIDYFEWLNKYVALKLIDNGKEDILSKKIKWFKWLDKEVALKLIEKRKCDVLSKTIKSFEWLNKEVALKLIDMWGEYILDNSIGCFEWLDKDVALKLIDNGKEDIVGKHVNCFKWFDLSKDLLIKLINNKKFNVLPNLVGVVKKLDKEIAIALIENGRADVMFDKRLNLRWLDKLDKEVAMKLIDNWKGYELTCHIGRFEWFDKEFAMKLIDDGHVEFVGNELVLFKWLDKEVAMKLKGIDGANIRYFEGDDKKEIAEILIWNGIEVWNLQDIFVNMTLRERENLAKKIIKINETWLKNIIGFIPEIIPDYKIKDIVLYIIDEKHWDYVINHIDTFSKLLDKDNVLDNDVAVALINKWYDKWVANNLHLFKAGLWDYVASTLIKNGYVTDVKKNKKKFSWLKWWTRWDLRFFW